MNQSENPRPVAFHEIAAGSMKIGVIRLDHPRALNSLTLDMVRPITQVLELWSADERLACVVIHSDNEKAFCAGGDVKTVATELRRDGSSSLPARFFAWEYRMDHLIGEFPKPLLCWGDGIVMGGGVGIFRGASRRVVTERSLLAMPEITIGFFPDVGGGHFLNLLPPGVGLFLGWTAARLSSADALRLQLATDFIPSSAKKRVFEELARASWTGQRGDDDQILSRCLNAHRADPEESHLARFLDTIERALGGADEPLTACDSLCAIDVADPWWQRSIDTFRAGSPTSARVIHEHLLRCRGQSRLEVFAAEWNLAMRFCERHDFIEGVRALLIDKDQKPDWRHSGLADVPSIEIQRHFDPVPAFAEVRSFLDGEGSVSWLL